MKAAAAQLDVRPTELALMLPRAALLLGLSLLPASPKAACAAARCTCAFDMPDADAGRAVESQLRSSSSVFLGTAVRIDSAETGPVFAHFAVARQWKGAPVDTVAVAVRQARRGPSTCEIDVRVGESYLVFARPRGAEQLQTHRCDGTILEEHAGAAMRTLRRLESVAPEV